MMRKQRGVTLMELMVVVVIIGILASIAYPSYRAQVRRSNRTEARVALEQTAGALEKCYTRYMAYNDNTNCPTANQFNAGATIATPRRHPRTGRRCSATRSSTGPPWTSVTSWLATTRRQFHSSRLTTAASRTST